MKYKVTLNGKTYEVEVEAGKAILLDEYEACAPAPAAAPVAAAAPAPAAAAPAPAAAVTLAAGETIEAPMPGNILSVSVKQGDQVKEGQVLAILEAMKMENEIPAPKDGTIVQVVTAKGAVVETGSPLFVLA
ncbi:MAG: biotin/lipoyl-containing protein [Ruminococcus sp.]